MKPYLDHYDVILIGGGIASLAASLVLSKSHLKVLILEKHSCLGGMATSFVRQGYEMEASLHEMMSIGPKENPYLVRQFFNDYGIDIDWLETPESYRFLSRQDGIDFVMPHGYKNCIEAIEKEVPGSKESVTLFLKWCDKVYHSSLKTGKTKISGKEYLKDHFELMISSSYSVKQMMEHCKIPLKAQKILSVYWNYLGTPLDDTPFTPWAYLIADYLSGGSYIPRGTTAEMSYKMMMKAKENGVQIETNQEVEHIGVKGNKVTSVKIKDGPLITADYIISNAYPNTVYSYFIPENKKTKRKALKIASSKQVAVSCLQVNLILNQSPEYFHFDHYANFISVGEMDSRKQFEKLKTKDPFDYLTLVCFNQANPSVIEKGKTMISITTLPFGQTYFDVTKETYFKVKEEMAKKLITKTEQELGIDLLNHTEVMEVITPVTISHYSNAFYGSIYGYTHSLKDNVVARSLMKKYESVYSNLFFVGAHEVQGDGMACVILSGIDAGKDVLNHILKRRK